MKPIFSRNTDIDKIAFLNWRISKYSDIQNIFNLAEGYMIASIRMAKRCLKNNDDKSADILIFPILANVNHGIELYLKGILWTLNKILKIDAKIEGNHNIKQLYETVRSKIKAYGGQIRLKDFNDRTAQLRKYIKELFEAIRATPKNDKMDFSRYPFSKDYENHFYVDCIGNVEIDLENFIVQFKLIKNQLEEISDFLYFQELNNEW